MFFKTCATLALATAAAATPILAPRIPEDLPAYQRRGTSVAVREDFGQFGNGNNRNNNNNNNNDNVFDLIDGFQNFRNQDTVVQVQQENVAVIQNGNDVRVIQEQVNQVLVVDQNNNRNRRDMNNLFRKSNFRNNNRDQTTVLLVVTEVQISVDDGRGNKVDQSVFAQSAVVANRGQGQTNTVMIFESRTLIQQDIINGNNNNNNNRNGNNRNGNNQGFQGFASGTISGNRAQQTADVQLFGQKPTWSSVAADPAETLGAIWAAELQDAQNVDNNAADNEQNKNAAAAEKKALEDAAAAASATSAVVESSAVVEATATAAPAEAASAEATPAVV